MIVITSRENKMLKLVRSLHNKKARIQKGLYFAEGRRLSQEAFSYANNYIHSVLVSESFAEKNSKMINEIEKKNIDIYVVEEKLFAEAADTETPQGIGVIMRMPADSFDIDKYSFVLALDGVSEPGNLGTIIRTAEAAGVDGILLFKGCADIYNSKVVRSTMGSLFRMPYKVGVDSDFIEECKNKGFYVTATALRDSVPLNQANIEEKRLLIIGSEATGISDKVLELADQKIRIPMEGKVESLNAAIAAGIAMYTFNR